MSIVTQLTNQAQQELLENFVLNNDQLEELESHLSQFNLFEAIGVVRQELEHSNFLAFLLDPSAPHRLGDLFLKKILIQVLTYGEQFPLSPLEIDIADLKDVEVYREWQYIDLLLICETPRLVVAIENKVDAKEGKDQLPRYKEIVTKEFPEHQHILIFLTKEGDAASDTDWTSFSYRDIAHILELLSKKYGSTMGDEVQLVINHYIDLIRRHLVSDSDIAQLCRKIYKQHRQAIDLIYEYRPDLQLEVAEFLEELIRENAYQGIVEENNEKQFIRFAPQEWDELGFQKGCQWTGTGRFLLFEFVNESQGLEFHLIIGPGEKETKSAIFEVIKGLKIPGIQRQNRLGKFSHIWIRKVLEESDYDEEMDDVQSKIRDFFDEALQNEVRIIRQAICEQFKNQDV